jgi:hypothetical protein
MWNTLDSCAPLLLLLLLAAAAGLLLLLAWTRNHVQRNLYSVYNNQFSLTPQHTKPHHITCELK